MDIHFAHITVTDVGFAVGLFASGVVVGVLLATRFLRDASR